MGEERTLYESESRQTIPDVVNFLQQLSQWIADQRIVIQDAEETVMIEIPHNVMLEIEVEEEDEGPNRVKRSLEIEIEWIEDKATRSVIDAEAEKEALEQMSATEEEE